MSALPLESLEEVDWSKFDFVDLGCSTGGSINHCVRRFGVTAGIGIDIDPRKVSNTREAGYEAILADARLLDLNRQVSFISMLDFFEHLPSLQVVEEILAAAARSARDFIYIKHPSFEGEEQFEARGLRQYWWDWHGHTCHIRVSDYCRMFDRLGLHQYLIRFVEQIDDSSHDSIVPTDTPRDTGREVAAGIAVPERMAFQPPLWRRQDIFVALRAFEPREWAEIVKPTARDRQVLEREAANAAGKPAEPAKPKRAAGAKRRRAKQPEKRAG